MRHPHGVVCRAQILAKKVSARAFKVVPGKQGESAGEIGIEGTAIEAPTEARLACYTSHTLPYMYFAVQAAAAYLPWQPRCFLRN